MLQQRHMAAAALEAKRRTRDDVTGILGGVRQPVLHAFWLTTSGSQSHYSGTFGHDGFTRHAIVG